MVLSIGPLIWASSSVKQVGDGCVGAGVGTDVEAEVGDGIGVEVGADTGAEVGGKVEVELGVGAGEVALVVTLQL